MAFETVVFHKSGGRVPEVPDPPLNTGPENVIKGPVLLLGHINLCGALEHDSPANLRGDQCGAPRHGSYRWESAVPPHHQDLCREEQIQDYVW